MMLPATRTIKYTVEHHRKDGVSEDAFMQWFTTQFLPRAVPLMKKHNILKYTVQKADPNVGAAFQAEVDHIQPGGKVNDCDLVLEYWVDRLQSIRNLASDPEWIQNALEHEKDWLDTSRATVRIGYDTTYLADGAMMNVGPRRSRVSANFD